MQWRQRDVTLKPGDYCIINERWPIVLRAAVGDPMPDRQRLDLLRLTQPIPHHLNGRRNVWNLLDCECAVNERCPVGRFGPQPRL
jgi:hypothetical protein